MFRASRLLLLILMLAAASGYGSEKKPRGGARQPGSLDEYLRSLDSAEPQTRTSPGSLYDPVGRFGELVRDLRAAHPGDVVTILVADRASAVSRGSTRLNRQSQARASVSALGGPTTVGGPLSALAGLGGEQRLDSQGETTRESDLRTAIAARVQRVLPDGNLVIEGAKDILVNSERQRVTVRGLVRWNDLNRLNQISSDRVSDLEVRIDGRGVVGDGVRRPGALYRLLLGFLPF